MEDTTSLDDEVYGIAYAEAEHQMAVRAQELALRDGQGFDSKEACAVWAHENLLDMLAFSASQHKFYNVTHKGELIAQASFVNYYQNLLFYWYESCGARKRGVWVPEGFDYYDKARLPGEISDGIHAPLFYRDYTKPTGFYNPIKGAFNMAKPFPFFAKETGRDTSHIYTLISHVAGECAMWLLAWLRAKMINPTAKTQIVPIIVSRAQGSGKSTFGEVICKGLFGADNVLVTDQYDSQSRFNSDYADALIVCQEEKEETDRRNPAATIKSRATATTIRKEMKGIDPVYQESHTDFLMTTNKDVPIKFDGREDQRRFMIMQADASFTRKTSSLADEVFSKLYGYDADGNRVGVPFTEDKELVEQFKHELYTREDIRNVSLRNFPKTEAYNRCFTLPRTSESTEIESILRAFAPFIKESLVACKNVEVIPNVGKLKDVCAYDGVLQFVPAFNGKHKFVAICPPLIFTDAMTGKPMAHATVERGILDCATWLLSDFGIVLYPNMDTLPGGFMKVVGRYKMSPAARFLLKEDEDATPRTYVDLSIKAAMNKDTITRQGNRFRVNNTFRADPNGCFETVNELQIDWHSLKDKTNHLQYMDTFLLESDDSTSHQTKIETERANTWSRLHQDSAIESTFLYKERLELQRAEANRLFTEGTACRVVYSGAKSYHILVRVTDAPKDKDEYAWLHSYLCTTLSDKVSFDLACNDPARLTRSPIDLERTTEAYGVKVHGTQKLVLENFNHLYGLAWHDLYEQWLNRPMTSYELKKGIRLKPSKPEYQEAMEALIAGTFWTDSKWDSRRQNCFFPAYRLLRSLGYTHEELWTDDYIYKGLDEYAKADEIGYWRSREQCALINTIDNDYNKEDTDAVSEQK